MKTLLLLNIMLLFTNNTFGFSSGLQVPKELLLKVESERKECEQMSRSYHSLIRSSEENNFTKNDRLLLLKDIEKQKLRTTIGSYLVEQVPDYNPKLKTQMISQIYFVCNPLLYINLSEIVFEKHRERFSNSDRKKLASLMHAAINEYIDYKNVSLLEVLISLSMAATLEKNHLLTATSPGTFAHLYLETENSLAKLRENQSFFSENELATATHLQSKLRNLYTSATNPKCLKEGSKELLQKDIKK